LTYIATDEGWLFLAVVIDLFSRKVVGWSMRPDMQRKLVIDALEMAWFKRNPGKKAGLIFHSDRDEADFHIPTATTTMRMKLILKTRPVKRYAF
jgi:transposase InsO family protein